MSTRYYVKRQDTIDEARVVATVIRSQERPRSRKRLTTEELLKQIFGDKYKQENFR